MFKFNSKYFFTDTYYYCCSKIQGGYGEIAIRSINCPNYATNLFSCEQNYYFYSCNHNDDVGARCYGKNCLFNLGRP